MLDLHAHVLPGIDDGPRTLEDAVALARALADDGIEHVVATPHIYPGVFDNTPDRIADAFERLRGAIADSDIRLTMTWAAEVRICPEIIDWLERRRLPLLNGSLVGPSTVLIELPDGQIPVGTDRLLARLVDHGITPLMAHPERNKAVMEQPNRLEALRRLGCRFQLTAGSIVGDFGSRAKNTAVQLLEAGWVDVVASDAHNLSGRRPRMSAACAWISEQFGAERAEQLFVTQPAQIAGVTSFAVQSGDQRLVFRDLPAAPLSDTTSAAWAAGLSDLQADLPPQTSADPSPVSDDWRLTDFRIDSIMQSLQQGAADALSDSLPSAADDPSSSPSRAKEEAEDWTLPTPVLIPRTRQERPSVRAMPTLTPTPTPAPAPPPVPAPAVDMVVTPVAPPRKLRDEPRESPPPRRPPADSDITEMVHVIPPAVRPGNIGMRLHDVTDPTRPRPAEVTTPQPTPAAEPVSPYRTPPRFSTAPIGSVRSGLAQAQVQGLASATRRPVAMPAPVQPEPAESPLSVRVRHQVSRQDVPPPAPPSDTPKGFRLSDLPPLQVRRGRPA